MIPARGKGVFVPPLCTLLQDFTVSYLSFLAAMLPGPRFDKEGTFLPHSILGKADNFATELKERRLVCW
jgi:hypothetical protein